MINNKTLFGYVQIPSIAYTNTEIIKNIMVLHGIDRFDLDCTYSIGNFWKKLPQPKFKSDIEPQRENIIKADSKNLPFENISLKSIMFDPPFIIAGTTYMQNKKGSSIIAKRFGAYKNFDDLRSHYKESLKDIYRVLKNNGILVFKCQDIVSNSRNYFTHCIVMNMAVEIGFYPKDLFILITRNKINSFNGGRWNKQYHARKYHSYFWVLQKTKCKVIY